MDTPSPDLASSDPASQDEFIAVVCPLCRTRMHARRSQIGKQLKCPDCGCKAPILEPERSPLPAPRPDAGEYRMHAPSQFGDPTATSVNPRPEPLLPAVGPASTERPAPAKKQRPEVMLVTCPLCHTRMHPPASARGKRVKCPDCGTIVLIPLHAEAAPRKHASDLVAGQYDLGNAPSPAAPRVDMLIPKHDIVVAEPPDPAPRWILFSGVFGFPWQVHARTRWIFLTFGLFIVGGISAFAESGAEGSFGGIVAVAALGVVILMILLMTAAFASACLMSVVRETAAGVDVIETWPEQDWREWVWSLLAVIELGCLASGLGYGAAELLHRVSGFPHSAIDGTKGFITLLAFPILLLSTFDNGSLFAIYSLPVLRSLLLRPRYWLLFHLETLIPLGLIVALGIAVGTFLGTAAIMAVSPLLAAFVLIYARLLGRMALVIGDLEELRDRRRELEADSAE